jgi:hypothetical protein
MGLVWFIYPETANVRLEDMNSLFGDATSVMPTPETLAEAESLFSGNRSPVPSLDIRGEASSSKGRHGADSAIPGLDIEPPNDAQVERSGAAQETEGVGGWISNMVGRMRGDSGAGEYRRVADDED